MAGAFVTAKFEYAVDPTPFGSETPPRDLYTLSRICRGGHIPCPGVNPSDFVIIQDQYNPWNETLFDTYVLPNITDCFVSGFKSVGDLRTSPFEIQFRQYQTYEDSEFVQGSGHLKESKIVNSTAIFTTVENLVLLDRIVVREGIIADLVNGGVGFRNHTVPTKPRMKHGAQWTENILWLEPVTTCIDTNWSVGQKQRSQPVSTYHPLWATDLWLVNRGGGIVPTQIPERKLSNPPSQSNPELYSRVHLAGSIFNYRLSELLHLSSSNITVGSRYLVEDWNIWTMMSFWDFDGHKGLTLGRFQDPFNLFNHGQPERVVPQEIQLDPAQFNLTSFDATAFEEYYSSLSEDSAVSPPDITVEDACE
jgi:hypothetical protein